MTEERLSWDEYFMQFALLTSKRSSCNRLQVGCTIIKNNRILSTGYNGFIQNAPHISIVSDGHEQATVHAEMNAIAFCAKNGINSEGSVAYITHYPCISCYKILVSAGITKIIYLNDYKNNPIVELVNTNVNIPIIKYKQNID